MKKIKKIENIYIFKTFKDNELLKVSDWGFADFDNAVEYLEKKGFIRKYKDEEIEDLAFWKYKVYTLDGYEVMIDKLTLLDN